MCDEGATLAQSWLLFEPPKGLHLCNLQMKAQGQKHSPNSTSKEVQSCLQKKLNCLPSGIILTQKQLGAREKGDPQVSPKVLVSRLPNPRHGHHSARSLLQSPALLQGGSGGSVASIQLESLLLDPRNWFWSESSHCFWTSTCHASPTNGLQGRIWIHLRV